MLSCPRSKGEACVCFECSFWLSTLPSLPGRPCSLSRAGVCHILGRTPGIVFFPLFCLRNCTWAWESLGLARPWGVLRGLVFSRLGESLLTWASKFGCWWGLKILFWFSPILGESCEKPGGLVFWKVKQGVFHLSDFRFFWQILACYASKKKLAEPLYIYAYI